MSVSGNPVALGNGVALSSFTGNVNISAAGNNDSVVLSGKAAIVMTVAPSAATLTTDQNSSISFGVNIQTSFADEYTLVATAPVGWTVTIAGNGTVSVTPESGAQGGTFPIQIIAQSKSKSRPVLPTAVDIPEPVRSAPAQR